MTQDLRTFLDANRDIVLTVPRPVSRDHLSALIVQADRPVLFERIDGFPGWRVCDLLFRDRRAQARVLGTTPDRVLPELAARLGRPPVAPRTVDTGPVKERIVARDQCDLLAIPGFQHGARDPGPSLIAMTICRAPDGGNVNFAFTRMAPFERRRATYLIGSSPHMRAILQGWEARDEPMPMACVIGTHPAYEIMASYSVPDHLDRFGELELVGNLTGEPVDLVRCETVPLDVPAHAEVVIEGHVIPHARRDDGPGPSQALYYLPGVSQQPVFEVSCISMRRDPILRQHDTLMYSDHQPLISLPHEALLFARLRAQGVPVRELCYVPWGGTLACVVQLTPAADGEVQDVLRDILEERWPNARLAVAVDDDVDVGSAEDLVWSIVTRVDPARDIVVVPEAKGHPIDPTARLAGGGPRDVVTAKWAIDATRPSLARRADRARFERTVPPFHGEVRLADYLNEER